MTPTSTAPPATVAGTDSEQFKVLMAPTNYADQPMALVRALRRRGITARHVQYTASGTHQLGYALDQVARMGMSDFSAQLAVLDAGLAEQYDIYHFWQRSLFYNRELDAITGLDLALLKSQGARIFHRFTGFDLRLPTLDRALNPHSPYHHGFTSPFDEHVQRDYIAMLREMVDVCFVQDPELLQFMPSAQVLPRGLELAEWEPVGVAPSAEPLVVHAPSQPEVKGSRYIVAALEELRHEGLRFRFELLEGVPHAQAKAWYRKADIIVDQILIGATGVLTLEAWALGKPCVTYLRRDLFEPFYRTSELPVANATPATIKHTLRELIGDFEWRRELARNGRRLVEEFHDIERIAATYATLCRHQLASGPRVRPAPATRAFFTPRLTDFVQPELPPPGLDFDRRPLARAISAVERFLYRGEVAIFRGVLRLQGLAFRGVLSALLRLGRRGSAGS